MADSLVKTLQEQSLDILRVIDRVAREHGIPYYLFYGTELGAVRHQGFIPWDDDIDLILFRKDFEKFREEWKKDPPEGYFYQDGETDPNYKVKITKIRKNGTALVEEPAKDVEMHHGVWVDLFVLDDYVENGFLRRVGELITLFDYNASRNYRPGGRRGALYAVTNRIFRKGGIYRWWYQKVYPKLKKDPAMCSDITSFTFSHKYDFRREWLGEPQYLPFEGVLLPVPADTDATLRVCYGDYMTPPPPEKQVSNHHPYYFSPDRDYHPGMDVEKGGENG